MAQFTKGIYAITQVPALHKMIQLALARPNAIGRVADEIIKPKGGEAVLDLGCGAGQIMPFLGARSYIGVDLNPAHIEAAKQRFPESDFRVGDAIGFLETTAEKFDLITMIGLLHHLDDNQVIRIMSGARRSLNPGGRVVAFDAGFEKNQNPIAWLMSRLDSGRNVRTLDAYLELERQVFPQAAGYLRHDLLRVPYTHVITVCTA
ncbi:MAG TPA: class I SAM-dependent methyltransferase [Terriglobia bacterium]|nr:class I SAM-dependent methyltransferase [Terriglobia bacterium]